MKLTLRPCVDADLDWIVELRAVVLRDDLERLGRHDPVRVRQRMRDGFTAANTQVIVVDGVDVGLIAMRPEADAVWLEYFYIAPEFQGCGIGSRVLGRVLEGAGSLPIRLNVLRGSGARRLYERHLFTLDASSDATNTNEVDLYMTRLPDASATETR